MGGGPEGPSLAPWGAAGSSLRLLLSDPVPILRSVRCPRSYNLLPRIIEAKYLDVMDAEH